MERDFTNFEVDIASLPRYEEVKLNKLQKGYLLKLHLQTFISLVILGLILTGVYFFLQVPKNYFLLFSVLVGLMFMWSFYSNYQLQKRNGYSMRERDLIYRKGFLFERITVVPFNRIQHVSVARSFLDKTLDLSTLKVFTAGGSGSDINIPGLSPDTAKRLKEELSERISSYA